MKVTASTNFFLFLLWLGCLLGILAGVTPVQAQLRLLPLESGAGRQAPKSNPTARQLDSHPEQEPLSLPFWDDFSSSRDVPDTLRWFNSPQVAITNTLAVRPPSFNTATFDGIDAAGRPYSQDSNASGPSDSLVSHPIRLGPTAVTDGERSSVYMSFFWQLQGHGNRPDSEDSLRLYFRGEDAKWHVVWEESGREEHDGESFQQELISLQQAGSSLGINFFHDDFQMKFVSRNRQSGMYDLWHIDYIYLDKNRSSSHRYYQDRTISVLPVSLFAPYTALPIAQYFAAPQKYTSEAFNFTAFSLEQPGQYEPMNYSIVTMHGGNTVAELARNRPFQDLLQGQQHFEVLTAGIEPAALQAYYQGQDSLYLSTLIKLFSEEGRPFFNQNDTARVSSVLHDYFAYDDGSAEYGLEFIGSRGVRLAVAYELEVRDTLTHVELYLPYFQQSLGGQFVDIQIWKRLGSEGGDADSLLYTERDVQLTNSPALNQFNSYQLRFPQVMEPGTFYVGIEKRSDRFLVLGFDRNTDTRDKVFVSTDGRYWSPDMEDEGSIMLRPRFEQGISPDVLGVRQPGPAYPVQLFPNPNRGQFRVVSEARQLQLFNSQGQLLKVVEQAAGSRETVIDLQAHTSGLYFIKLLFKDAIVTKKVLINP